MPRNAGQEMENGKEMVTQGHELLIPAYSRASCLRGLRLQPVDGANSRVAPLGSATRRIRNELHPRRIRNAMHN